MKRYILDLTACDLPWFPAGASRVLPVESGNFEADLDLIPEMIDDYGKIFDAAKGHKNNQRKDMTAMQKMPLGFNIHQLPVGAVLKVVEA